MYFTQNLINHMNKNILLLLSNLVITLQVISQNPFITHSYTQVATPNMFDDVEFLDMDNDGDIDLMNWDRDGNGNINFYRSNGISIDSMDFESVYISGDKVKPVDWNNDGLPDLIYNYNGETRITLNLGGITFGSPQTLPVALYYSTDTSDINNDGFADLINWGNYTIGIYENILGNTTPIYHSFPVNSNLSGVTTTIRSDDIENNGLKEIFVRSTTNKIHIYAQTGTYDYVLVDSIVSTIIGNAESNSFSFEDMNNDGTNELIFRNGWNIHVFGRDAGYTYSLRYSGNASYSVSTGFDIPSLKEISDFYDVDNNGFVDIVAGNSVFFNNGSFNFTEVEILSVPRLYDSNVRCTDLDNDGKTDLCFVHTSSNTLFENVFLKVENNLSQTLSPQQHIWYYWLFGGEITDFDLDGDFDLTSETLGKAVLRENVNDTLFPKYIGSAYSFWSDYFDVVDINQDGFEDMIYSTVTNFTDDHGYRLNLNGQSYTDPVYFASSDMRLKLVDDIDGDGIMELFYHLKSGSTNNYVYMYKSDTGIPVSTGTVLYWTDFTVEDVIIKLADVDLDGYKDVIIQHEAAAYEKIRIALNNGDYTFSEGQIISCGCMDLLGVFDSNGDNLPDLHWHDGSTRIYRNLNSNGVFAGATINYTLPSGTFSSSKGTEIDLNNDFFTDLVVQSQSSQRVFKNLGNGLTLQYSGPATNYISRIKDLDNDGDLDLIAKDTWYENINISPFRTVGTVYYDMDNNSLYDSQTDVLFPNFPIQLNTGSLIEFTNNNGHFDIPLGSTSGNFNISMANSMAGIYLPTSIPYPSVATVNTGSPTDSVSIGVYNTNGAIDGEFDVTISGHRCNETGRLFLNVRNLSPENVAAVVKVKPAENTSFLFSNISNTFSADTIVWNIPQLSPFENLQFYADLNMPGTQNMGDTMAFLSEVTLTGVLGTYVITDTLMQILTCAYDPNDKNISLTKNIYIGDSIFSFVDETEYIIRFQNTGNDTAKTVIIRDNISSLFDWGSIKPISASASYNFTIDSLGIVEVVFDDINLPDSSTNFLGSMGYVKFKVDYKESSPNFVPIINMARIYFDENPPIFTNYHKFFRADCRDFINVQNQNPNMCGEIGDTVTILNNDLGLPFLYTWSYNAFASNQDAIIGFPVISSGLQNYNLAITSSFCSIDTNLTFNILEVPDIQLSVYDTTICIGEVLSVTSNIYCDVWMYYGFANSGGYSYAENIYESSVITAITTNAFGCSDTATTNITVPELPGPLSDFDLGDYGYTEFNVCSSSIFTVHSNFGSINWSVYFGNGTYPDYSENADSTSFYLDPNESSIWIEYNLNYLGCTYDRYTQISVNSSAPIYLDSINQEESNFFCNSQYPTVFSNWLVDWSLEGVYIESSISIDPVVQGTYTANACGQSTWFEINNLPTYNINDTIHVCVGSDVLMADGVILTNIIASTSYTSYFVTNDFGCDSIINTYIEVENFVDNTVNQFDFQLEAMENNANYQWLDCGNGYSIISGATSQSFVPTINGSYAVEVSNGSCIDTSECFVVDFISVIALSNGETIRYFPNPTLNEFQIELGKYYENISISIRDSKGTLLDKINVTQSKFMEISLSDYSAGIYIIQVETDDLDTIFKIAKY